DGIRAATATGVQPCALPICLSFCAQGKRDRPFRAIPPKADLAGAQRWEELHGTGDPVFVARKRSDVACIVYSSGTGGRPKGCMKSEERRVGEDGGTGLISLW